MNEPHRDSSTDLSCSTECCLTLISVLSDNNTMSSFFLFELVLSLPSFTFSNVTIIVRSFGLDFDF